MKHLLTFTLAATFATAGFAGEVELGGMKSKAPDAWKEEAPSNAMRLTQFKLPKAEGDADDAELVIFVFKGGSGSAADNFKRQLAKFKPAAGKDKVEATEGKIMVGKIEAPMQDISATYLKKSKPFDPADKGVEKPDWRQLYVVVITDKGDFYPTLVGPAKTVEKHKKDFEEFLKNFK